MNSKEKGGSGLSERMKTKPEIIFRVSGRMVCSKNDHKECMQICFEKNYEREEQLLREQPFREGKYSGQRHVIEDRYPIHFIP